MAGHRFGERERDIGKPDEDGVPSPDHDALSLYEDMVKAGFQDAAMAMLARHRIRHPDTRICPVGPHLLGTAIWTFWSMYDVVLMNQRPKCCPACFEHRLKEMREKSYGATRRVPPSMQRVQQSQHRPGARSEERWFARVRHYDYPWRRSKHGNLVLKKSWEGVKGLVNPQYLDYRSEASARNDEIIREELRRREARRRGKAAA